MEKSEQWSNMPYNLRKIKDSALPNSCWVKLKINAMECFLVLRNKNLMKYTYILVSSTTGAKNLVPTLETKHLTGQLLLYQKAIITNRRTFFFCFNQQKDLYTVQPEPFCFRVIISIPGNWTTCLLKSSECTFEVSQVINTSFFGITLESGNSS